VRESLRQLQALGAVHVAQGRGAFVREPRAEQILPQHALELIFASPERAQAVHEARLALELGLTELAVQRATPEDIAALREIAGRAEAVIESSEPRRRERDLLALGLEFHLRLAETARSPVLAQLYALISDPMVRTVARPHERHRDPREDLRYHLAVADALERRDATGAVAAMRAHVEQTTAIVLAQQRATRGG
jgi:DNA-binding FadR family transcriptional regulator